MRIAVAAFVYLSIVFGVGFLLGPIRVLWLEARWGLVIAELCEAPFLIVTMALAARWVPSLAVLPKGRAPLALMGLGALVLRR